MKLHSFRERIKHTECIQLWITIVMLFGERCLLFGNVIVIHTDQTKLVFKYVVRSQDEIDITSCHDNFFNI